jgi:23S rRNA (guanine1835-N2)-methyltransferase
VKLTPTPFHSPFGEFDLSRYPSRNDEVLLAWCSADLLLLEEVKRRRLNSDSIVVVNDTHGALSVALQPQALWTDSALAVLALRSNERANGSHQTPVFWATEMPAVAPELVVMRIPKQLTFFEFQLSQLSRWLQPGAAVLAAGMDKHLSPRTAKILERFIGTTERLPGKRKARLFYSVKDDQPCRDGPPEAAYYCAPLEAELHGLPNVFCRDKLDTGTRFLIEQLHVLEPTEVVMDLACGNGALGLIAMHQGLAQKVVFCDESAMAIASARLNADRLFPEDTVKFFFHHGDGLETYKGERAQLILCNPPFHQEHTVNEFVGRRLLAQCGRHLQRGGCLFVVANRHLDYLSFLRKTFSKVEKCAANAKFVILRAYK